MIKLTKYSHGAGCGCKISPKILDEILKTELHTKFDSLLVGNASKDDAAAVDIGNGKAILSTTDFFMPIVDDPYTFGKIAATNAISDIYSMGGKPLMAISIFGWPIEKLSSEVGRMVIDGGRAACLEAGIPLAGGHSIDSPEPIFGLAVTGIVNIENLKKNNSAKSGCDIFLTKPIGVGILTTAQKKNLIEKDDIQVAIDSMCTLNKIGSEISKLESVLALTDITGFGLLGHLTEICESSGISAIIKENKVPLLKNVDKYLDLKCIPGGTIRNYESYSHKIEINSDRQKHLFCDPQTSGGLLAIVEKTGSLDFINLCKDNGITLEPIGETIAKKDRYVYVK